MTTQLTAATSSKLFAFCKDFIFEYFDIRNTFRHFDVGKMLSTHLPEKTG